ncbi:hypothetical protein OMP38_33480 [Cohnella ginsengisoli]|uniref:Uncharacterized protein n=1 Tax=Cohnella ginsengisoli TaxID=425004 RepID=A0A9X4KMU7_9BACL|nr:hypothetical protein [Cohnella ginsengisoli]MDG0795192.1 hypothetical protein [Cohnella ginsengisoli]
MRGFQVDAAQIEHAVLDYGMLDREEEMGPGPSEPQKDGEEKRGDGDILASG